MPLETKQPGDIVEGFKVLKELGRGAASVIYVVQDPKTKQVWALKHVVKETDKDQRFIDQAEQEYLVASKINSDKVRRIEKVIRKRESLLGGTSELWLVMELVDGVSCEVSRPKTFEDALFVFEQVAQGLAEMHAAGFVHADMKPNNVIVDDQMHAKIIDLGQSCKIGTVKQRIQGTPDYIAPEQVHRRAITPKTDVYNLGAAMYWIFTNQYVPSALGKEDSLLGTLDDKMIPRPKHIRDLNQKVPETLGELIMDCVEIDPDARPNMELVADRLNLIRSRLLATRRLGGSSGGSGGSRGGGDESGGSKGGSRGASGSKGGSGSGVTAGVSRPRRKPGVPPIDPGPGLDGVDELRQTGLDEQELGNSPDSNQPPSKRS